MPSKLYNLTVPVSVPIATILDTLVDGAKAIAVTDSFRSRDLPCRPKFLRELSEQVSVFDQTHTWKESKVTCVMSK